eukprot:756565-Heterocapsa_arctica.AAC.1
MEEVRGARWLQAPGPEGGRRQSARPPNGSADEVSPLRVHQTSGSVMPAARPTPAGGQLRGLRHILQPELH